MELVEVGLLIKEYGDGKKNLRTYTEVGGYDLTFLGVNNDVICDDCAIDIYEGNNDWKTLDDVEGAFIHWEGAALSCDECNKDIKSEYGNPFEDDEE